MIKEFLPRILFAPDRGHGDTPSDESKAGLEELQERNRQEVAERTGYYHGDKNISPDLQSDRPGTEYTGPKK